MYGDMAKGRVTVGNSGKQHKVVQTVGPRVGWCQSTVAECCFLRKQLVQQEIVSHQLLIPLRNLLLRSLQLPCTIAVGIQKT